MQVCSVGFKTKEEIVSHQMRNQKENHFLRGF